MAAALYYFVAAPRVALAAIERAASADDVTALAYHLDLESVRAQLRADLEGVMPAAAAPGDDPLERLAAAFGTAVGAAFGTLVGTTVAELVASPEGILQLLGGVPLRPLLGGAPGVRNSVAATFDRATHPLRGARRFRPERAERRRGPYDRVRPAPARARVEDRRGALARGALRASARVRLGGRARHARAFTIPARSARATPIGRAEDALRRAHRIARARPSEEDPMRHRMFRRWMVAAALVALTAFAQAADRPAGWGEESHSSDAGLDYATVFPDAEVNEIVVTIAAEDWAAMQANMVELAGEPGTGAAFGALGAPADGARPARPEGAPPAGGRPGAVGDAPAGAPGDAPGGGVELITENPMWVEATIEMDGLEWTHVGVRYKGNSTLLTAWQSGSLKLPFKFDFDEWEDDYPEIENQRFYGFKQLSLSNAVADASYLRNPTANDLLAAADLVTPADAFYHVTLDYGEGQVDLGLYVVMEVIDDTVIDEAFDGDDGNIYEGEGDGASFAEGTRDLITESFQKENNDDEPSWADVEAVYDALHASTRTTDPEAWRAGLDAVFDTDTFLRWLALEGMMQNWDTYGEMPHNYYLYADPATGQLTWVAWDHDRAFSSGETGGRGGGGNRTVTLDRADRRRRLAAHPLPAGRLRLRRGLRGARRRPRRHRLRRRRDPGAHRRLRRADRAVRRSGVGRRGLRRRRGRAARADPGSRRRGGRLRDRWVD